MPGKPQAITYGPWFGADDTPGMTASTANLHRLTTATNLYAPDAPDGDIISRPGVTRHGLGSLVSRTGTADAQAITAGTNYTLTGTGTAFLTELAVGDWIIANGVAATIRTAPATNTSVGITAQTTGTISGAITYYPAGIKDGPLYGAWQYTTTTPGYHALALAKTTLSFVGAAGTAGHYAFTSTGATRTRLIQFNPGNSTHPWTDRTDETMDGVALATDTRIYATTFANYFVISDGTNRLRKITSAWVLSNLTDSATAAYGQIGVYYGKMFIIDGTDRVTLRWSDENDPDTGYGTGTSDNAWTLRQTSSDQLENLIGTNDALYCHRQNSTAIITGAANSDFRSSGTVDAVQNIGTRSPDSVLLINSSVCFIDQYGRPGRIQPGYGYVPLWKRCQETIRPVGSTAAQLRAAWGRYDPTTNLVRFSLRFSNAATTNTMMLVYDAETWEWLGTWNLVSAGTTGIDHAYAVVWLDENIRPRFTVLSGTTADCAAYVQKTDTDQATDATDTLAAGEQAVACVAETPKMGGDPLTFKNWLRLTAGIRNVGGASTGWVRLKSQYRTTQQDYQTAASMTLANGAGVGVANTYNDVTYKLEQQGLNAQGRYLQAKFTNDTSVIARFTLDTVTAIAVDTDTDYQRL